MFEWNKDDAIVIPLTYAFFCVAAIIWRLAFKNAKPVLKTLPLKILAVTVLLAEIAKQIYYNCFEDFTLYILPLHFCSLFFVIMPLSQLCGKKVGAIFKPATFVYSFFVLVLILVNPHTLIGNSPSDLFGSFHNTHTFIYHMSVVAYFIFSAILGDYDPKPKHCINVVCGIAIYTSYAVPCAYLLNTNYVNILYSQFAPLEKLRLACGQFVYNATLFLLSAAAGCLVCLAACLFKKAVQKSNKNGFRPA